MAATPDHDDIVLELVGHGGTILWWLV